MKVAFLTWALSETNQIVIPVASYTSQGKSKKDLSSCYQLFFKFTHFIKAMLSTKSLVLNCPEIFVLVIDLFKFSEVKIIQSFAI